MKSIHIQDGEVTRPITNAIASAAHRAAEDPSISRCRRRSGSVAGLASSAGAWSAEGSHRMTLRLVALCLDAVDPSRLAGFWAGLLGRDQREDADGAFAPGDDTQVNLRFVSSGAAKLGRNRVHLHLTSASQDDQQRTVATALRLGASHLDVGQLPDEDHVVLADPEGNEFCVIEFCVIEAGNSFLAGCGLLAELACEGTRAVGLFWSKALGWPLVWDQDQETAVQSSNGGTKGRLGGPARLPADRGRPSGFPRGHPARRRRGRRCRARRPRREQVLDAATVTQRTRHVVAAREGNPMSRSRQSRLRIRRGAPLVPAQRLMAAARSN